MSISSNDGLLVCAIDFGTTFSGYAYSMKSDFEENPLKISLPDWKAPSSIQISQKTPTTLLLDSEHNFVSFGYEAESKYAELTEEEEHHDYCYFRRFKMVLYNQLRKEDQRLTMETRIKDITEKKETSAIEVFSHSIRFMKDHMLDTVRKKGLGVRESEINWVLTVPAMWSDPAKQFMTKSAEMAGIPRTRLILALEPEVASIYCSRLPLTKLDGLDGCNDIGVFKPGSKYLVLDAGGGTVDITVHQMGNGTLKELEKASGGDWGGTCVDNTFRDTLIDVVSRLYMEAFRMKYTGDYIELFRDFEMKKRKKTNVPQSKVTMKIPATFSEWFEEYTHKDIIEETKESKYSNSMKWEGDKLRITQALFDSFFQPACAGIIDHVNHLLEKPNVRGTQTILMVGGFSESPILQTRIRAAFPDFRVVVPNDAGLVVLRGAVLFGHNPRIIMARVAKYTYGFASFEKFNSKIHRIDKKMDGKDFCKDIFDVHVRKGASLLIDEAQAKRPYEVNREDQTELDLELYVSDSDELPKYVTDPGCHYLGTLKVQVPKPKKGKKHGVNVQLIFGGTELRVKAENMSNGDVTSAEFNFLGEEP